MSFAGGGIWPYVFILVAGFAVTDFWRIIGVMLSARINEDSEILRWVRAVATALVAGLVARLVLFPVGDLAATGMPVRVGAVAIGMAVFFAAKRSMLAGVVATEAAFLAAIWLPWG